MLYWFQKISYVQESTEHEYMIDDLKVWDFQQIGSQLSAGQ